MYMFIPTGNAVQQWQSTHYIMRTPVAQFVVTVSGEKALIHSDWSEIDPHHYMIYQCKWFNQLEKKNVVFDIDNAKYQYQTTGKFNPPSSPHGF